MFVPPAIATERLKACHSCKFYVKETGTCGPMIIGKTVEPTVTHYRKKVKLCGCFMKVKTKMAFAKCPIGTWHPYKLSDIQQRKLKRFVDQLAKQSTISADDVRQLFAWKKELTGKHEQVTYCGSCVKELLSYFRKEVQHIEE